MSGSLAEVAHALARDVQDALPRLQEIEDRSGRPWAEGKWTRKQVLGHLIDSALNNYHRVIRAQQEQELRFPDYQQEHWVSAGGYDDRSWADLVQLWAHLNVQLAHAILRVPDAALPRQCFIGQGKPVTLEFIVRDYPRHLMHHLAQILDSESAAGHEHRPFTRA